LKCNRPKKNKQFYVAIVSDTGGSGMEKEKTGGKFLIMDGHSLAYRAFFRPAPGIANKKRSAYECGSRFYENAVAVAAR
jgi:hypothetical protein